MQARRFSRNNKFKPRSRFKRGGFPKKKSGFSHGKIDISKFVQKGVVEEEEIVYVPKYNFQDFEIDSRLKHNIISKGYREPTPIQDKVIPLILKGKDVVGIANTGTGKTAAFLIPTINKALLEKSKTIIIVPTRELAMQIEKEFRDFSVRLNMFSVICIGGTNVRDQLRNLKRKYEFIIGTPGRIKDMVERGSINMSQFKTVVLDEADRMLDMGFIEDMRFLLGKMPQNKQALLFSATLPDEVDKLARTFLKDPEKVSVKTRESSANVEQDIVKIGGGNKTDILCEMLSKDEFRKVLIFGRTKRGVEKLSKELFKRGFKAESIHGDKTQAKRKKAIEFFKSHGKILVATDVAARGLDINNVTHVINYDIPATYEDYVHRIGRTGRGKKKGKAITFV